MYLFLGVKKEEMSYKGIGIVNYQRVSSNYPLGIGRCVIASLQIPHFEPCFI